MLFTLTTTGQDRNGGRLAATDLGFVLHKHPDNVRTVATTAGPAHVFWPEAEPGRATVATLVDVDPIGLVRRGGAQPLAAYVNDRPYIASSFLSVAIGRLFRSAMNGDGGSRPELVDRQWDVSVRLPAVPIGGDRRIIDQLFGPLGYASHVEVPMLDPAFPHWGSASVADVTLRGYATMADLLRHLYVLLPVLDDDKHYWIDDAEVAKLLRNGSGWLDVHPEHKLITRRYLADLRPLTDRALEELASSATASTLATSVAEREAGESPPTLNTQRTAAVVDAVRETGAASVVDLGCGEGKLLQRLAEEPGVQRLVGVDVSMHALRRSDRRLRLDRRPERQKPTIELRHSSLTYRDPELAGFDMACLIEVIEHLDPERLDTVERLLFGENRPRTVIVTTPNRDHNRRFNLATDAVRHRDHRFEWTRAEFEHWCRRVGDRYGYRFELRGIGPNDPELGPPTQMALLTATGDARG